MSVRDQLIQWWPVVDVGKIALTDADVLVVRVIDEAAFNDELEATVKAAFPGRLVLYAVGKDCLDFATRPRVQMRPEDLVQPKRVTTMD